jgi:hypothetical protein
MLTDAIAAVRALPGVGDVTLTLDDHFASPQINAVIAHGTGFADAFPGQSTGEPEQLRDLFTRKAFTARQSRVCDRQLRAGRTYTELAKLSLAELEPHDDPDITRCIELRQQLGINTSPDAPAFVLANGWALDPTALTRLTRIARLIRLSLEGNTHLCRTLLATRYHTPNPETAAA